MKDIEIKDAIPRALKEAQKRRSARAYVRMRRMEDAWKEAQREGGGYVPEGDARVNGSRNVLESASVCKGGDVEEVVVCTNCEVLLRVRKVLKERT